MVFARKKITKEEFESWNGKFQEASLNIEEREQKVNFVILETSYHQIGEIAEDIEKDLVHKLRLEIIFQ